MTVYHEDCYKSNWAHISDFKVSIVTKLIIQSIEDKFICKGGLKWNQYSYRGAGGTSLIFHLVPHYLPYIVFLLNNLINFRARMFTILC